VNARGGTYPLWELELPVLADAPPFGAHDGAEPADDLTAVLPVREPEPPPEIIQEARREAKAILEAARAEAEQIAAQTQESVAEEVCKAREAAAHAVVAQQEAALRELWEALRATLSAEFDRRWADIEEEAGKLCLELAESILRQKIPEDDEVVLRTVREGLATMPGVREVTLRVSPQEERRVRDAAADLLAELPGTVELTVIGDVTVGKGGALVQSSHGEVDLRVESQFARLRAAAESALEATG
jgi:flagellar biosynthesis/type III secretory pathway protein FliH